MSINTYVRGSLVRLSVAFTDENNNPVTPATITLKTIAPKAVGGRPPGELVTRVYGVDASIQNPTTGSYYCDIAVDVNGIWRWRWEATGASQSADEGSFIVESLVVQP